MHKVQYSDIVLKKDLPKLSEEIKKDISTQIKQKLLKDPLTFGKPLRYSYKGMRSFRVGDYRVLFCLDIETVHIVKIKHRSKVYKD